jgi:hypothetical protein
MKEISCTRNEVAIKCIALALLYWSGINKYGAWLDMPCRGVDRSGIVLLGLVLLVIDILLRAGATFICQ